MLHVKCGIITICRKSKNIILHCFLCSEEFTLLQTFVDHLSECHETDLKLIEDEKILDENAETSFNADVEDASLHCYKSVEHIDMDGDSKELEYYEDEEIVYELFVAEEEKTIESECNTEYREDSKVEIEIEKEYEEEHVAQNEVSNAEGNCIEETLNDEIDNQSENNAEPSIDHNDAALVLWKFTSAEEKHQVLLAIIQEFKKHVHLWNNMHRDYKKRHLRTNSFKEITKNVQQKFPTAKLSREAVRRKIAEFRNWFRAGERGKLQAIYKVYYEELIFLRGQYEPITKVVIAVNKSRLFECPTCAKEFKLRSNLSIHMRRHQKDYSYKCNVCGKQFYSTTELNIHTRFHTKEKPYICEFCGKAFPSSSKLQVHRKSHLPQCILKCTLCPKSFHVRRMLDEHMNSHTKNRSDACNICGKAFYSKRHLLQHIKIHSDVKQYKCLVCEKSFAQSSGRTAHMRTHKLFKKDSLASIKNK